MISFKDRKVKLYLFAILFLIGLVFLFFNEFGVVKYLKLKTELNSLKQQITEIEKENKSLDTAIDSLQKKIPAKIEETAREKYNMIRRGEKVIEIREK